MAKELCKTPNKAKLYKGVLRPVAQMSITGMLFCLPVGAAWYFHLGPDEAGAYMILICVIAVRL
jgi:hypothetical protein